MTQISIKVNNTRLSKRQSSILNCLVTEFIKTSMPVSSAQLKEKYKLGVSPATIRIELAVLENKGYVCHPHTSAGKIPADKGIRFFINSLEKTNISEKEKMRFYKRLEPFYSDRNRMAREAARLLSEVAQAASLVILPDHSAFHSGVSNLLAQKDLLEMKEIFKMVDLIDNFDEHFELFSQNEPEVKVYIGQENPIDNKAQYAMIVSNYNLFNWGKGILTVFGPQRLYYDKVLPTMEYVSAILEGKSPYEA